METRLLESFITLTSEGNFSRAAARLHITQSALSQQIQRLEQTVGAILLDRSVVPFTVTVAGERVLNYARQILESVDELAELTEDVRMGRVGRVRIGIVHSLLYSQIPSAIHRYRSEHPNVDVEVKISPTGELYELLRLGQLETAFVYTRPEADDLATSVIYRDTYLAVLPSDHPLAAEKGLDLGQLRHDRLLMSPRRHSTEAYDAILGACVASGFSAHDLAVERSSYIDQVGLVAAGMGVSLLPSRLGTVNVPGVTMVPLVSPHLESTVLVAHNVGVADTTRDRFIETVHGALTA